MKAILAFCLMLGFFHFAFCSAQWPNEPAGSTTYLDYGFDPGFGFVLNGTRYYSNTDGKLQDSYHSWGSTLNPAQDNSAPFSPPGIIDEVLPINASSGGSQLDAEHLPNALELYVGMWWSTNADFVGMCNNTNKMFFVKNDLDNSFLQWYGPPQLGAAKTLGWGNQTSYSNAMVPGWSGDASGLSGGFGPNVGNGSVLPGSGWHRIEMYLKTSTTTSSRDGIIRWWLDGRLIGNVTGVNQSPGGFKYFSLTHTWDGSSCLMPPNRDMSKGWHHYWDHLRISIPNCGTGGCAAPKYLIINSSLPAARTGVPYTATLSADGGVQPYTWFLESGNLPAGLSLSKGVISGTPTCVGRSDFNVRVTDASQPALSVTKSYTIITSGTGTCVSSLNTRGGTAMEERQFSAKAVGGKVTFSLPQLDNSTCIISVFDLAGKQIYERKLSSNGQNEVPLHQALKNGIYFARLSQEKQVKTVRFNVMN